MQYGRTIAIAALVCACAAAAPSAAVDAHWSRGQTVRVWIDPARAPAGGALLVEKAMKTWTTAADGRFSLLRVDSRDAAAVRLHFMPADYRYGVTAPRVDPATGLIVRAEVAVAADAGRDDLERAIIVYLTALHELGHALGLSHTSDFTSIMYLFRQPGDGDRYFGSYRKHLRTIDDIGTERATGLSADDVTTLRALYDR